MSCCAMQRKIAMLMATLSLCKQHTEPCQEEERCTIPWKPRLNGPKSWGYQDPVNSPVKNGNQVSHAALEASAESQVQTEQAAFEIWQGMTILQAQFAGALCQSRDCLHADAQHNVHCVGEQTWNTRRFCRRSGKGNSIFRSSRPGRSRAGSSVSALLVAMMTLTLTVWSNPSIWLRSSMRMRCTSLQHAYTKAFNCLPWGPASSTHCSRTRTAVMSSCSQTEGVHDRDQMKSFCEAIVKGFM